MKTKSRVRLYLCLLAANLCLLGIFFTVYGGKYSRDSENGFPKWTRMDWNNNHVPSCSQIQPKIEDSAVKSHRNIKGTALSRPCCVSWGPGHMDCFVRGGDGNVHRWWKENGKDHGWESLCGNAIGDVECVSRGKGHIDIMIRGSENALWTKAYNGYWDQWRSRGGRLMEVPSCVARTPTDVECAYRGITNHAYNTGHSNGKWRSITNRGGILAYPFYLSRRSNDILDLYGSGTDNSFWRMSWTRAKSWSGWIKIGEGPTHGRPMAVSLDTSRTDVFVMGMASRLMHRAWDGKNWLPWEDLEGKLESVPSCVALNATIHCFGVGPESNLYRRSYVKGQWSNWIRSYGPFRDTPSCIVSNANEVSCYVQNYNREVEEIVYAL